MILMQKLREEQHLSKHAIEHLNDVTISYIGYAENRGFRLYDEQLRRIAEALDYDGDPSDLLQEVVSDEQTL